MFGRHRRPADAQIIGTLRTEINRLVLALSRAGVIDPQTGEERSAVEILKDAQYWKNVAMELGHKVDALERERDALREHIAALVREKESLQAEEAPMYPFQHPKKWSEAVSAAERCSKECREGHLYGLGCVLAGDYAESVTAAQREHDIQHDPATVPIAVVKPLWAAKGVQQP